jgi:D-proline reductase (dithiol) PrdB
VLAHIFEATGIATIVLSSIREMTQKVAPPRALHCEFPLGRPLGIPNDAQFQHDVLQKAFVLLDEIQGPVLVDYPVVIEAETEAVACALPPRFDPDALPAVDEARGIRKAYDRARERHGVTSVGRAISADEVPSALEALHRVVNGEPWAEVLPVPNTTALCHDIRTYYACRNLSASDSNSTSSGRNHWIRSWRSIGIYNKQNIIFVPIKFDV